MTTSTKSNGATRHRLSKRIPGDMVKIHIDKELETLIPPLGKDELAALTRRLWREGCQVPLLVWRERGRLVLVDGHHTYRICQQHAISFLVRELAAANRAEVRAYMREVQLARRNLGGVGASYQRGKQYLEEKRGRRGARKGSNQFDGGATTGRAVRRRRTDLLSGPEVGRVDLQVVHVDGRANSDASHMSWTVTTDANGTFSTKISPVRRSPALGLRAGVMTFSS
jgi:hypothetical protein